MPQVCGLVFLQKKNDAGKRVLEQKTGSTQSERIFKKTGGLDQNKWSYRSGQRGAIKQIGASD